MREPQLFLFDEPLSNLDAELRVQMRVELAKLYNRLGTTMIYVTHDQVEAMTMATRIAVLSAGNLEQLGTPVELYTRPQNMFVATFIGSPKMNMMAGKAGEGGIALADFGVIAVPGPVPEGTISVGVRPEQFHLGEGGDVSATGRVTLVEYLGSEVFVHVRLPSGASMMVKAPGKANHKVGDELPLGIAAQDGHYFDAAGLRLPYFDNR